MASHGERSTSVAQRVRGTGPSAETSIQKLVMVFRKHNVILFSACRGFLTNHALVLLCIARDPGARLRDIAGSVGITERSAFGIVSDLAAAGYIVKEKGGRRNRYRVVTGLPVPESADRSLAIGDLLDLLGGTDAATPGPEHEPA
jgi:hypothetical protein